MRPRIFARKAPVTGMFDSVVRTRVCAVLQQSEARFRSRQSRELYRLMGDVIDNPVYSQVESLAELELGQRFRDYNARDFRSLARSSFPDADLLKVVWLASKVVDTVCAMEPYVMAMTGANLRSLVNEILREAAVDLRVTQNGIEPANPDDSAVYSEKFGILRSPRQLPLDFDSWRGQGADVALVFFDIDFFKKLNTEFTESEVDDKILAPFQKRLLALIEGRGGAYHIGGDEFILLLRNVTTTEAEAFGQRVVEQVRSWTFRPGARDLTLTVSVGVASRCHRDIALEQLRHEANLMESEAKRSGRDRCVTKRV